MISNKSTDKSKQVNWIVRKATRVVLTLTFTASGAYNTSGLTLSSTVYDSNDSTLLSPTIVNGGVTGIVTLTLTNTQTNVVASEYFWMLKTTTPLDQVLLQGLFKVNDFTFDSEGDSDTGSVIVDISGTSVTISMASA
jgi:hypothetical protein